MAILELTSKDNPLLKTIRLISSGSRRAPNQIVLAEGLRVLEEVNKAGHEIEAILISEDFGSALRESQLLSAWRYRKIRIYKTKAKLFQSLSTVQTPQGAIALVKLPDIALRSVVPLQNWLMVYACGIQDPGNLGTLIRAASRFRSGRGLHDQRNCFRTKPESDPIQRRVFFSPSRRGANGNSRFSKLL